MRRFEGNLASLWNVDNVSIRTSRLPLLPGLPVLPRTKACMREKSGRKEVSNPSDKGSVQAHAATD
jgi:hypothetical protein